MSAAEIVSLGESALIIRLSNILSVSANDRARAIADVLEKSQLSGITDVVPANSSVGVYFTANADTTAVRAAIMEAVHSSEHGRTQEVRHHEIPVKYDGPDIEDVAARTGLTVHQIAEIHSAREYQVFAIGFAPGFGYLGELDERISIPRRSVPRTKVPAGSVAIANRQTAIYPFATPGGWNLIGTTSVQIFDQLRNPASLFRVGDRVRFLPRD